MAKKKPEAILRDAILGVVEEEISSGRYKGSREALVRAIFKNTLDALASSADANRGVRGKAPSALKESKGYH